MKGQLRHRVLGWLTLCLLCIACEERELCLDHPHTADVRLQTDWSQFEPLEVPTGMTAYFYSRSGRRTKSAQTNQTGYVDAALRADTYDVILMNQSPSEFGTLLFSDMEHYDKATVYAAPKTSRWYKTKADEEVVVQNPEWLGVANREWLTVAPEMVQDGQVHTLDSLRPAPVAHVVRVVFHIKGIYNVRSARASLEGMAKGYCFSKRAPTREVATQLLEDWKLTRDPDNPANGTLVGEVVSFGLPDGHSGLSGANRLHFSLLLVDNQTQLDFDYAVGDRFEQGVDVELTIIEETIVEPMPDVKPEGGSSSGFDASVEDWGEEVKIDIDV